jgi:RsmE family RNA methyltransferase
MNLMLLPKAESRVVLPPGDPRAAHVRNVLGMKVGDRFDVGAENGPRGKARIAGDDAAGMVLELTWGELPKKPLDLALVVGLSRPQTMRKILREAPALGVGEIVVAGCLRSEAAYAASSLWTTSEWRDLLRLGTEQAFSTYVPRVSHAGDLASALDAAGAGELVALDNYEATASLAGWKPRGGRVVLCVGPERGWDGPERNILRDRGALLAHLGSRVLRTETAMIAGVALVAAKSGDWDTL